jgi:hypothetical protein
MNENQIADIWMLFKEHLDRKVIHSVAEQYITMLMDHEVSEKQIENAIGFDDVLDEAISEQLEILSDEDEE